MHRSYYSYDVFLYNYDYVSAPFIFGDVNVFGRNASADVGYVTGDINLYPYADSFDGFFGTVGGDIELNNAWWASVGVAGSVYGSIKMDDSAFAAIGVAGSVYGGIEIDDSFSSAVAVGYTPFVSVFDSNDMNISITFAYGSNLNVFKSDGTQIDLGFANGALVNIGAGSAGTSLDVFWGDTFVFDSGAGTQANLGGGNDVFVANNDSGWNPTLVNGESGYDILVKSGDGDVIADNFEFANIESLQGDTVFLGDLPNGNVDFGNSSANLYDLFEVFGENVDGNAVLNFNDGGSITAANGAEDYISDSFVFNPLAMFDNFSNSGYDEMSFV